MVETFNLSPSRMCQGGNRNWVSSTLWSNSIFVALRTLFLQCLGHSHHDKGSSRNLITVTDENCSVASVMVVTPSIPRYGDETLPNSPPMRLPKYRNRFSPIENRENSWDTSSPPALQRFDDGNINPSASCSTSSIPKLSVIFSKSENTSVCELRSNKTTVSSPERRSWRKSLGLTLQARSLLNLTRKGKFLLSKVNFC